MIVLPDESLTFIVDQPEVLNSIELLQSMFCIVTINI